MALIAKINVVGDNDVTKPFLASVTHLKASKTIWGEQIRRFEAKQLQEEIMKLSNEWADDDTELPSLLLTDLNASPKKDTFGYDALAYSALTAKPEGKLKASSLYFIDRNPSQMH